MPKPADTPKRKYTWRDHERLIARMKEHVKKHGPLPHNRQKCIDPKLVFWSRYVRSHILTFSREQLKILLEAGFFNYREEEWLVYFWQLSDFAAEHGHCRTQQDSRRLSTGTTLPASLRSC